MEKGSPLHSHPARGLLRTCESVEEEEARTSGQLPKASGAHGVPFAVVLSPVSGNHCPFHLSQLLTAGVVSETIFHQMWGMQTNRCWNFLMSVGAEASAALCQSSLRGEAEGPPYQAPPT